MFRISLIFIYNVFKILLIHASITQIIVVTIQINFVQQVLILLMIPEPDRAFSSAVFSNTSKYNVVSFESRFSCTTQLVLVNHSRIAHIHQNLHLIPVQSVKLMFSFLFQ